MNTQDKVYWKTVKTKQFMEGISHMEKLRERGNAGMIIGQTGSGKSDMVNIFCQQHAAHTYRVTVSKNHKLVDIIEELEILTDQNLPVRFSRRSLKVVLDRIIKNLKSVKEKGGLPTIIIDEGENLDISVLKTIKGLYDALINHCAIIIIGTSELIEKMLNKASRHRGGIPQLYDRFEVGIKYLSPIDKATEFPKFFNAMGIDPDLTLSQLFFEYASTYRGLNKLLEPLLREADKKQKPLNEELFRLYHDKPKLKRA